MSSLIKKVAPIAIGLSAPFAAPALGITSLAGTTALGAGLGAAGGAIGGGGLKGALLGGITGGAGSYIGAGGLGTAAGTTLDKATGIAGMQGATQGTGALGSLTRSLPSSLSTALQTGVSNLATPSGISDAVSAISGLSTQDEMKKKLLAAQGQAQSALSPYLSAGTSGISALQEGFDPSQITSDAGYQFRLQQGQDALEKSLAAKGMSSSGAALKAAQDYGQGLAAQAYNDAYSQWLAKNSGLANYGQNATGTLTDIYGNIGNIGANAALAKSNTLSSALSNILSGGKKIIGYDASGNPIYGE